MSVYQPAEVETFPRFEAPEEEFKRTKLRMMFSGRINIQLWMRPFPYNKKIDRLILRYGFGRMYSRAMYDRRIEAPPCVLQKINPKEKEYRAYSELKGDSFIHEFFIGWRLPDKEDALRDFFVGINFLRLESKMRAERGWYWYTCYSGASGYIKFKTEIASVVIFSPSIVWFFFDTDTIGFFSEFAFDYGILNYRNIKHDGHFYGIRIRNCCSFRLF